MSDQPAPPDGTKDGDGYWHDGRWYPLDEQYHRLYGAYARRGHERTVEERAQERANDLNALAYAYQCIKGVPKAGVAHRAAVITVEALKAWERANLPEPLDPLLFPKA